MRTVSIVHLVFLALLVTTLPGGVRAGETSSDEKELRGLWHCLEVNENGKAVPKAVAEEEWAVFTDKEVKLSGMDGGSRFTYRLDATVTPKRCEMKTVEGEGGLPAIYKLDGDMLTMCWPMIGGKDTPYPTRFEPGKGVSVKVFQRVKNPPKPSQIGPPRTLSKEESEVLDSLRKAIRQGVTLLEAKKYMEFIDAMADAETLRGIAGNKSHKEAVLELMTKRGPTFSKLLGILVEMQPAFDSDRNRATYDIRTVHVDGFLGRPRVTFVNVNGQWRFEDKR
jgi:uncharacterized protein (TIGR03067 family)